MLTSDLVRATRRGGLLHVTPLGGKQRERAEELAQTYLDLALAHVGAAHHELKAAWAAVEVASREVKLAAGLTKLIEDACELEAESQIEPRQLRSELFSAAAAARRALAEHEPFERKALLERVGQPHALTPEQVEQALYSDLKSEHRLLRAPEMSPEQLLSRYDLAQLQAVLLKAVKVSAQISCATPEGYREIFRKLKFRRLMFEIRRETSGGYRIDIDGPFSLFESVTKYGLQLAMMLPALLAADRLSLEADLRWGKAKTPLKFSLEQKKAEARDDERARLPDEVEALLEAFAEQREGWRAAPADKVLDLPGVGLCVPDLCFTHQSGASVFLEVLGYWSRDAVWRRIELVQKGLGQKLLFAASQRLRVSEEALADHPSGALYVYKGSLSAKAVLERLERLRQA
jgi:uncharacterized protein